MSRVMGPTFHTLTPARTTPCVTTAAPATTIVAPATVNRRLAAILSLYIFLADKDLSLVCPVLPHRHGLKEPQCLPRPVLEEGLRKFFAVVDDIRDRAMFTEEMEGSVRKWVILFCFPKR